MRLSARSIAVCVLSVASLAAASDETASPCSDWKAWLNVQPGTAAPTLHVTATCQFPTAGYAVELVPVSRKIPSKKTLELKKVVHKPEGMAAQVISDVPLNYTRETMVEYETVLIKTDKVRLTVEKVH
jgi:hypothetical protein